MWVQVRVARLGPLPGAWGRGLPSRLVRCRPDQRDGRPVRYPWSQLPAPKVAVAAVKAVRLPEVQARSLILLLVLPNR